MRTLCCVLLLVIALSGMARADSEDGGKYKRRVAEFQEQPHFWRVDTASSDATIKGFARAMFTTNGFPRWRHQFFARKQNAEDSSKVRFKFRVGLFKFFEFVDTGADGWNVGDGNGVSSMDLVGQTTSWSNIAYSNEVVDGQKLYYAKTTFSDASSGTLMINNTVTETRLVKNNVTYDGNRLTWGITLKYTYSATPNTKIAAVVGVETDAVVVNPAIATDNSDIDQVAVSDSSYGKFRWKRQIVCTDSNGVESYVNIIRTALLSATTFSINNPSGDDDRDSKETRKLLVLTFNTTTRCSKLEWDPENVVDTALLDNSAAAPSAPLMSLVLAALTLLGLLLNQAL